MLTQSKGKIFLSEDRGTLEMDWFRSYTTFNFGKFYNTHKTAFGALYVLNDDTLAAGKSVRMEVEQDSDLILIPIVGSIAYRDYDGHTCTTSAGQVQLISASKGLIFEITNPYGTDLVRFLQIWLLNPDANAGSSSQSFSFDLHGAKDRLVELFSPSPAIAPNLRPGIHPAHHGRPGSPCPVAMIGKFAGREDAAYQVLDSSKGMFAFVIEGVFEVQYRLLHPGDGLALWGLQEVQLEALSNDAIILLIEIPLTY